MATKQTANETAMDRYDRKMAKKREADEVDARKVVARAKEISAGSKLRVDQNSMEAALHAFIEATQVWWRARGDARDYLSAFGSNQLHGCPWCGACQEPFDSERAYASHMMSPQHAFKKVKAEALLELRAHIHAFPIDESDYLSMDGYKILQSYRFRNL